MQSKKSVPVRYQNIQRSYSVPCSIIQFVFLQISRVGSSTCVRHCGIYSEIEVAVNLVDYILLVQWVCCRCRIVASRLVSFNMLTCLVEECVYVGASSLNVKPFTKL